MHLFAASPRAHGGAELQGETTQNLDAVKLLLRAASSGPDMGKLRPEGHMQPAELLNPAGHT